MNNSCKEAHGKAPQSEPPLPLKEVVNRVRIVGDVRRPELLFDNTPEVAEALISIGVHAVLEEGSLVVRSWKDIGTLYDQGLVEFAPLPLQRRPNRVALVQDGVIHLLFPDSEYTGTSLEYKFPISLSDKQFPQHTPSGKVKARPRKRATTDEPMEEALLFAYEELEAIIQSWLLGCEPDEKLREYTKIPSLSIFRNNPYKWEKGKLNKTERSPTGEQISSEITKDELREIHIRAKRGDRVSLDAFSKIHLGLVLKTVARLQETYGGEADDMVQAAYIGLMKALRKSDVNRPFTTYAVMWMFQSITRQYKDTHRPIRIPVHRYRERSHYYETVKRLQQFNLREPSRAELVRALEMKDDVELDKFERQHAIEREFVGLAHEDQLTSGHMSYESDVLVSETEHPPERDYDSIKLTAELNNVLKEIRPRTEKVIRLRYGLGVHSRMAAYSNSPDMYLSLEFVASTIDVTREYVRQIEAQGLRILRNPFLSEPLREFF